MNDNHNEAANVEEAANQPVTEGEAEGSGAQEGTEEATRDRDRESAQELVTRSDKLATGESPVHEDGERPYREVPEDLEAQIRLMVQRHFAQDECLIIMTYRTQDMDVSTDALRSTIDRIYAEGVIVPGYFDVELARYSLQLCSQTIAYVSGKNTWMVWTGQVWEQDPKNTTLENRVQEIILTVPALIVDSGRAHKAWKRVNSAGTVGNVVTCMRRLIEPLKPTDLDADPWLFNCRNGVIDLKTQSMRHAKPTDYQTKLANVEIDSSATCPKFEKFLKEIMLGDEASVRLIQAMMGYMLIGGANRERLMFWLTGEGRNGKSTLIRVLMELMGSYATSIPMKTLLKGNESGPRDDLMSLVSARLITTNEFDDKDVLNARTAKTITGNDILKARHLYGTYVDILLGGLLLIATNAMPMLSDATTQAIWDRMRILPFNLRIAKEEENIGLYDELLAEFPGILNFALEGLALYQQDRSILTTETPLMLAAKEEYRNRLNVVRQFISEHYEVSDPKQGKTKSMEIIAHYREWARNNGISVPLTAQRLKKEMQELGIAENATGGRYYCCVRKVDDMDDVEANGED